MFCDIGPTCYKIALQKEICKRHIKNFFAQENYADTQDTAPLPCAENITVCRRFTRRHWTHRPGSCCIGSLCWTTIPKSCMTPR